MTVGNRHSEWQWFRSTFHPHPPRKLERPKVKLLVRLHKVSWKRSSLMVIIHIPIHLDADLVVEPDLVAMHSPKAPVTRRTFQDAYLQILIIDSHLFFDLIEEQSNELLARR